MKPDLQALVRKWQERLRLQSWRIRAAYVRHLQAPNGDIVHGLCTPSVHQRYAEILIRDPETPVPGEAPAVEEIVVHELLHLHFAPLGSEAPAAIIAEENAVWAIAEAISKGAGQEAQMVARAMGARAQNGSAVRRSRAAAARRNGMDPKLVSEALEALIAGDQAKCAEILKGLVAAAAGAAAGPAPGPESESPMTAEAPAPPAAAPEEDEKKPPMAAQASAAPAQDPQPRQAGTIVSREEFNRFRVEQLVAQSGGHLSEGQRTFATGLSYDQARAYLAQHPAPTPEAARSMSPTRGAGQGEGSHLSADERAELDRRMGLGGERPAVRREGRVMTFSAMGAQSAQRHMAARAQKGGAR